MESYVLKTLKKLRKETPRLRLRNLIVICDKLIGEITDEQSANSSETPAVTSNINVTEELSPKYFEPLQIACESKIPRIMDIALDSIHYMIEHGYFRGSWLEPQEGDTQPDNKSKINTRFGTVVNITCSCADEVDDTVQLQVIKVLLTVATSVYCEVHEAILLLTIRTCLNIHLMSKNSVNKATAKAALTQMLSVVNQRMETFEIKMKEESIGGDNNTQLTTTSDKLVKKVIDEESSSTIEDANDGDGHDTSVPFLSLAHKDSFLVFRALCKLSMKGLQEGGNSEVGDQRALQNRILSLELILHILQHSGPAFRSGEKFIHVIRQQLCLSLLRNCTSQISQVTSISLQIFVCLMDGFKDNLKRELEVFVANIFIRILESENATFDHKTRVLEVFHILCTETSAMVEIFINYDCDMNATDLFRRIVDGFSKITKNPSLARNSQNDFLSSNKNRIVNEEQNLRLQGLEGLVIILRTLLRTAGLSQDSTADISQTLPGIASPDNVRREGGLSDPYSVIASLQFETQDTAKHSNSSSDNLSAANDSESSSSLNTAQDPSVSVDSISLYDRKQKMQEELESGILKFNLSPKKGLKYLSDLGHIQMNPKAVALFLFQYQSRLDKTAVGDYLGREREYENGFCLQVLHEYVDNMDFAGMKFDLAIRLFLSGFRLPGEAQKIDRLMEKFAERYYLQNRENFASADMAFILAFSTIMLQTNLHNPAIKDDKRMTKEQFIRQNKGISSDGELSDELLIEIYDRIQAQPISITQNDKEAKRVKKEEPAGFNVFQGSTLDRRRKEAFDDERKEMVRSSEEIFKQSVRKGDSVVFLRTGTDARSDEAYARPMFEIAWPSILGVLSHILETYSDPQIVELCLRAFRYAIRLACRLDFPIARHTLVNALSKFTTLDTVRPMEMKHIESINAFVSVVYSEGDWLDETWTPVLQTISQLARLQLFAEGAQADEVFFSNDARGSTSSQNSTKRAPVRASRAKVDPYSMDQIAKMFTGPSKAEVVREIEEANADLIIQEIEPTLVDKVYVNSHLLSEASIYHFVKSLCEVSMLEIRGASSMNSFRGKDGNGDASTPRIFSLQKLVEVADFNMGIRPRIVWANVWALLANHFSTVGINENHALAMYAVDSLKQLSIKFLQKDELSNFNFQRLFLKPFETIIIYSKAFEIKDLVLRCIDIMILACASNIRSGWKSIFSIFEVTAQEKMEIASIAFGVSERLILNNFDLLVSDFVELVHCLVAFVASVHTELSLRALEHLARCSDHLASGSINSSFNNNTNTTIDSKLPHDISLVNQQLDEDSSVFRLWWPLLLGLSTAVGDPRLNVRSRALETLRQVLHNHGQIFSPQAWGVIFKGILFPMIDSAKTDFTPQPESSWPTQNPPISNNRQSWIGTMATSVFNICIELFKEFEERASPVLLLSDLMKLIEDCISQESESLARIACKVYNDLIVSLSRDNQGNKIDLASQTADLICNRISKCIIQNLCIDYGEVGMIDFIEDTPSAIVELIPECPIGAHRRSKDDTDPMRSYSFDGNVKTPYGDGKFLEMSDTPSHDVQIPPRWTISLSWGAKLYTTDSSVCENQIKEHNNSSSSSSSSRLTDSQLFKKISSAAMTSMVISLDLIKVVTDVIETHYSIWKLENISTFLNALEVMFWHARSFNENFLLRSRLWRHGFMRFAHDSKALPHLLEQEIQTLSLMQFLIIKLYQSGNDEKGYPHMNKAFAEPWIQRIGSIVCQQYISLELILQSQVIIYEDKPFALQRHQAYNICVIRLLQALTKLSQQDFMANRAWLVPILSQLILCDDRNTRGILSQIYSDFINIIVLR